LLNLEEAILLRERGWKGPILLLEGFFHADDLPLLDKYRLTTSVHSNWQIKRCRMRSSTRRWISISR
jgi:alanine racemase